MSADVEILNVAAAKGLMVRAQVGVFALIL